LKTAAVSPVRRTLFVLAGIVLLVSTVAVLKSLASHHGPEWIFNCKPGPWGNVECVRIEVEMPEAFVSLEEVKSFQAHWFFKNQTQEQTVEFLKAADLTPAQLDSVLKAAKWEPTAAGCWVSPSDELVLALSPKARQKIYLLLSDFPENPPQNTALIFRPNILPERLKNSGLSDATIRQFNNLLYSQGAMLAFSDTDILVNHLTDDREKIRFLKTISRTPTLLVKLTIDAQSDINQLVDYWSYGGRKKDVRSLLESMAAVPGGCKIDIAHLLPMFVRQRIYTFPNPTSETVTNQHCHWTSLNFLNNDAPDNRFSDENFARQTVQSEFIPVTDAPRLGDVMFFLDGDGMVVHSATFIADNIVFTKNGGAANRPWIYMELEDLLACYMKPREAMKIVTFRRKQI
jgi:hypothetical protein